MKSSIGGGYRKKFMGFHLALIFSEPDVKKNSIWRKGKASRILLFSFGIKNWRPIKQRLLKRMLNQFQKTINQFS